MRHNRLRFRLVFQVQRAKIRREIAEKSRFFLFRRAFCAIAPKISVFDNLYASIDIFLQIYSTFRHILECAKKNMRASFSLYCEFIDLKSVFSYDFDILTLRKTQDDKPSVPPFDTRAK